MKPVEGSGATPLSKMKRDVDLFQAWFWVRFLWKQFSDSAFHDYLNFPFCEVVKFVLEYDARRNDTLRMNTWTGGRYYGK